MDELSGELMCCVDLVDEKSRSRGERRSGRRPETAELVAEIEASVWAAVCSSVGSLLCSLWPVDTSEIELKIEVGFSGLDPCRTCDLLKPATWFSYGWCDGLVRLGPNREQAYLVYGTVNLVSLFFFFL
jgi:hypothetical protein